MTKSDLIDLDAEIIHQTAAAYLFDFGDEDPVWIAKTSCEYDHSNKKVTMREGLAYNKGLI